MKLLWYRILVLCLCAAPLAAAERDIVRTFPVRPGCSVVVDTFRGAIIVTEADTTQIRVAVHLEIGSDTEAEADQMVEALQLDLAASGASVNVRARDPQQSRPRFVWNEKRQIAPTFRITVPRSCNLDLRTRTGAITVGNVTGILHARAETGDVFFRTVGGRIDATTETGDVIISRCTGDLVARTKLGMIRVGTVMGSCDLQNGNGDVEVLSAKAALHVYAEVGTAAVGFPRDFAGKAEVVTSGGNIVASIDPTANCDVEASASFLAHVESRIPLQILSGRNGSRHLSGRLNHGGDAIVLHASGGNVRLLPRKPRFDETAAAGD